MKNHKNKDHAEEKRAVIRKNPFDPKQNPKQKRKQYVLIGLVCIAVLGGAYYSESHESVFQQDGSIERNQAGDGDREVSLVLNAEGLPEDYEYTLQVEEALISEEESEDLFHQAEKEIDESFWAEDENADHVTENVNPMETYADGLVQAEWHFDNYSYITSEGVITSTDENGADQIPEEGVLIGAAAQLTCGDYTEDYSFTFHLFPENKTFQEKLIADIRTAIHEEMEKKGQNFFLLPGEVDGIQLNWSSKRSYLTLKVFFWLAAILVLMKIAGAEEIQDKQKKRKEEIAREYPEIVSKLSILMGAGMSLKQAWMVIANRYEQDHGNGIYGEKPAYEEMILTMREMRDGKSEKNAYQSFGERCQVNNFYRLSRILVRNLQKGNKDLCDMLQKEAEEAFEDRKMQARKKGEEAGTKMLIPLMLMMVIVIAIVIVPAFMGMSF